MNQDQQGQGQRVADRPPLRLVGRGTEPRHVGGVLPVELPARPHVLTALRPAPA